MVLIWCHSTKISQLLNFCAQVPHFFVTNNLPVPLNGINKWELFITLYDVNHTIVHCTLVKIIYILQSKLLFIVYTKKYV